MLWKESFEIFRVDMYSVRGSVLCMRPKARFSSKHTNSHARTQTNVPIGATTAFCPHIVHRGLAGAALQLWYKRQIKHDRLTYRHTSIKAGCNHAMHKNTMFKKNTSSIITSTFSLHQPSRIYSRQWGANNTNSL